MTEKAAVPTEKLLKLRQRVKSKKPDFDRPESWRYMRLKKSWRKPRGLDNKVRRSIKGWPPKVNAGYRGPKNARGLHPSGFREVIVHNPDQLQEMDADVHAVRIAHTVGKRKRARIIAEARRRKLTILNFKEAREAPEEKTAEEKEEEETETEEVAEEKEKAEPEKPKKKEKKTRKRRKKEEKQ